MHDTMQSRAGRYGQPAMDQAHPPCMTTTTDTTANSDPVLRLRGVALGYGDVAVLRGIDMAIERGRVVAVMGGSGSGKTTLLRAATGQIAPQAGVIQAFGQDIAGASAGPLHQLARKSTRLNSST